MRHVSESLLMRVHWIWLRREEIGFWKYNLKCKINLLLKFLLYFDSEVHEKSWSEGSECGGLIPDEGCYEELSFHLAPAHPSLLKTAAAPDQDHNNVNWFDRQRRLASVDMFQREGRWNNVCLDPRMPFKIMIQWAKCRLHMSMAGNICPTMSGCWTPPALSSLSNTMQRKPVQHTALLAIFRLQCTTVMCATVHCIAVHCIAWQDKAEISFKQQPPAISIICWTRLTCSQSNGSVLQILKWNRSMNYSLCLVL